MPIAKAIHKWTRIVPVRFLRAPDEADPNVTSGIPEANAPDPDDRGFLPADQGCAVLPVGRDESVAEADIPETRVRLSRQDIEDAGVLHVVASDPDRLEVTVPAAGAALPAARKMMVKFKAKSEGEAYLEVRFGSADGPLLHRLRVVVNPLRDVRLAAHVPTINGAAANDSSGNAVAARSIRTDGDIRNLIEDVNRIYFPHGIRFVLDAAIDRAGVLNFTNQGFVNDMTDEFDRTTALNRAAGAVNMYFVPQIGSVAEADQVGGSANSSRGQPRTFGSLIADMAVGGQTVAHELGHVLNLVKDSHYVHVNTVHDPARPGTGRDVRDDIVSRRRLMWAYTDFQIAGGMPYRDDVGYFFNGPGCMLTVRNLAGDRTDDEMAEVQRNAARLAAPARP